jgi:hypothetical protein
MPSLYFEVSVTSQALIERGPAQLQTVYYG